MSLFSSLRIALFVVVAAGAGLMVDAFLLRAALGWWVVPPWGIVLAHLLVGVLFAVVALGVLFAVPALRKQALLPVWVVSIALPLLYSFSVWERVCHVAGLGSGKRAALVGLVALLFVVTVIAVFVKIGAARDSGWLGAWVAGILFATLLVGNRTVVKEPFATMSLAFDVGCVLGSMVLLVVLRGRFKKKPPLLRCLALMIVVTVVAVTAVGLVRWSSDRRFHQSWDGDPSRFNVVVLVLDTMRGDVFYDVLENTLEGQSLQDTLGPITWFSEVTSTAAATPPTMSSIFSGLYPPQHGIDGSRSNWTLRIREDVTLLGQRLSEEGYATLAVVANRALRNSIGVHRGFDGFVGLRTATELFPIGLPVERLVTKPGLPTVPANLAIRALSTAMDRMVQNDRPLFLWFHLMDTHAPLRDHPDLPLTPGDEELTDGQRRYRNAARFAQANLALALEDLRERFPRENTLTIVLADHGEMLIEDGNTSPGKLKKIGHGHSFFESIVHVPLGIQLPSGVASTAKADLLVSQVDILPTVYDVLGLEADRELPGCSLVPWILDPSDPRDCRSFAVSTAISGRPGHRALRTPLLKVMYSEDDRFPPRLYELGPDPGELHDLAAERPEALEVSIDLLREFWLQFEGEESGAPAELTSETVEKLKALGYLQ